MENGSATNAQPTNSTRVLPRRKEPVIDSETANNKRIKRLTLKLEEIERERYQVLNMSKKSFYHATYRVHWTLRLSKFEHLDTAQQSDDASLDEQRLWNGNHRDHEESSLSDTDDDLNSSKYDEFSDDSVLSDDTVLTERSRLPSKLHV